MNLSQLKYWKISLFSFFLCMLYTGCSDDKKTDYINLSLNSFTFNANGQENIRIEIEASQEWQVEYDGRWVVEEEKTPNSITLKATATQSSMERKARVIFRAGEATEVVNLSQLGTNVNFNLLDLYSGIIVVSPNGKYIGGVRFELLPGDRYEYTPFTIKVENGQRIEKPKLNKLHNPASISDEGFLILREEGTSKSHYYGLSWDGQEELREMLSPQGFDTPVVSASSADGSVLVGFASRISDKKSYPVKWIKNELEMFNPTVLEIPERTLLDKPIDYGAYARGCSVDGSVIYGTIADDMSVIYWKNDKVNYAGRDKIKVHTLTLNHGGQDFTLDVVNRPVMTSETTNMSLNGRYLAVTFSESTAVNKAEKNNIFSSLL